MFNRLAGEVAAIAGTSPVTAEAFDFRGSDNFQPDLRANDTIQFVPLVDDGVP